MIGMNNRLIVTLVLLPSALFGSSAYAVPSRENLLANPNAEQGVYIGQDADFPAFGIYSTPEWTVTQGEFRAASYADGNSITLNQSTPGPPDEGNLYFFGGDVATSSGSQLINLSSFSSAIAAGTTKFTLAGWFGGFLTQTDQADVSVQFEDSASNAIGSITTVGPVTEANRGGVSELLHRATTAIVPSTATYALVTLTMIRGAGTANNGSADDLIFSITVSGSASAILPGDFNFDGSVDSLDIRAMEYALADESAYKADYNLDESNFKKVADINKDGVVNNADLQALLNLLKASDGQTISVPEPSTLVLAVLAFGLICTLRAGSKGQALAVDPQGDSSLG
jgi:hypothetical protein